MQPQTLLSPPPVSAPRTPAARVLALSVLMFLEHSIGGAWMPIFPLRMVELGFDPVQIGNLFAALSIAGVLAPWLGGQLADRLLPAQYILTIAHTCNAFILWRSASASHYSSILVMLALVTLLYSPTFTLANHIVFRQLADPVHEFGRVRLWGTASWVVMSLLMGLWLSKPAWLPGAAHADVSDSLRLAAILSGLLAVYSIVAPHTPPEPAIPGAGRLAIVGVLRMAREPSFRLLLVVSFALSLLNPFIYPLGATYLQSLGVTQAAVGPLLCLGQVSEVLAFLLLGNALKRFGYKVLFMCGALAFVLRFSAWSLGTPLLLVEAVILLHGLSYAFFVGAGQTYTNAIARPDLRASAQALHSFAAAGIGGLLGNWLAAGLCAQFSRVIAGARVVQYGYVFLVPAGIALLSLVALGLWFHAARPGPVCEPALNDPGL